jgi:exodeoxyribonuclease V alpha subunit
MNSREIKMGAPTGKAAKRITEVTGIEAKTLHRLLEFRPETGMFERNATNPIEAGMIAIDESSMPDIYIARDLSQAWGNSKILLIGDTDQLPSVGPGKVLADLLESGEVPHTRLQEIFRQSAGSEIALGAETLKNGRLPEMGAPGTSELVFIPLENTEEIAKRITDMVVNKMPKYLTKNNLDPTSIQVLSPGKQGEVGTLNLNKLIQAEIHKDKNSPKVMLSDQMEAKLGDKVIQLENDYSRNIFNGDTGKIIEIDLDDKGKARLTHVDFGDQIIAIEGATLSSMSLAYALTIHKSQGSEYQVVIIPVTNTHFTLMKRNLIYTGETRAKRICVFIGSKKALTMAVQKEDSSKRVTSLANLIKHGV